MKKSMHDGFRNLGLNITSGLGNLAIGSLLRYRGFGKGEQPALQLISSTAYKSMYAYAAMRTLAQISTASINEIYPKFVRRKDKKRYDSRIELINQRKKQLIQANDKDNENLLNPDNVSVKYRGKNANEALVLWVNSSSKNGEKSKAEKKTFTIYTYWDKISSHSYKKMPGQSSNGTVVEVPGERAFLDLGAVVQASSGNNVVLTKVQGRDYSRKELISRNDITFNVRGNICSNYPDVYPYQAVSDFLAMMRHKGIVSVYNLMFQQFDVTRILIKDFSLNAQPNGCKNVQPYSFTCVAVESNPTTDQVIDTLTADQNLDFTESKKKVGWAAIGEDLLNGLRSVGVNQTVGAANELINTSAYAII